MAEDIAQHLQAAILKGYSQKFKDEFLNPKNIGKLEHSDSHVRITGPCGDTVEMWLAVEDGKISDIRFMTDGCGATITCASYVTGAAKGKTIEEALRIEPEDVVEYFEELPDEHKHCAKLAVMTLTAAIEKYRSQTGQ
ncbi:MAG TPA: iron-sulfur cluster assembly scaffold protein [Sedimentisphaerales bacterium]|nr:iron-sulfur cluster assembly scaffold protein [Sedimentisphaerales bacterium]